MTPPSRVLIVDDVPAVREALRWALEDAPDFEVIGEADDGEMALAQAAALLPDIVILDLELPTLDGYTVLRRLKAMPAPPIVIVLTVHSDGDARRQGIAAGADGFVAKGTGWAALLAQVRQARRGR
jgi:DNA-binding NarL/FixJ family response regulator